MVVGLGIDMIEVARLEHVLARHPDRAASRLFTPAELADCEGRANASECLAGRFAAKEAFLKALGTGLSRGISWQDIALSGGQGERPRLTASGRAAEHLDAIGASGIHVSITHDGGMAAAVVVLEDS
ncbi:MAG: holo-ACP synthase [Gemmatimonadota bacterium]|nr:holo-ACP synthase [Gemmatimonadota bacterium]